MKIINNSKPKTVKLLTQSKGSIFEYGGAFFLVMSELTKRGGEIFEIHCYNLSDDKQIWLPENTDIISKPDAVLNVNPEINYAA